MTVAASCPRCGGPVRAPGLMSSAWQCDLHGPVAPLQISRHLSNAVLQALAGRAGIPVWSPLPLLPGWSVTGAGYAGDERDLSRASVTAFSGPSPLGGPADLLLIAEEPGVGVGARYAGVDTLEPGESTRGRSDAKLEAAGHPTALWRCASAEDRVAFVGEALGVWLYAVLWPPAAELVLLEHVVLHDLRSAGQEAKDLPIGAPSPRLV